MREPGRIRRDSTRAMSVVMLLIGVVLIVRTVALGGGPTATGILLGAAFLVAGGARLYIGSRSP